MINKTVEIKEEVRAYRKGLERAKSGPHQSDPNT